MSRDSNGLSQPTVRLQKQLLPRCSHTAKDLKSRRSVVCGQIEEPDRLSMFKRFWRLKTWNEKKSFIRGLIATRCARKRRKGNPLKVREKNEFHDCYLPNAQGEKVLMCKKQLLSTLSISKNQFVLWCKPDAVPDAAHDPNDVVCETEEIVTTTKKSRKDVRRTGVIEWLSQIPGSPKSLLSRFVV